MVSGAHQGRQGREATEPVGANFHHQPAHGVARMSNETASARRNPRRVRDKFVGRSRSTFVDLEVRLVRRW